MTTYEATLFHNGRPAIIAAPVIIGMTGLFMAMGFFAGQPLLAAAGVPVSALLLLALRSTIWDYFSEPATVQLEDDAFTIVLSGGTFRYEFGKLVAYRTYQGDRVSQIIVYPTGEKKRTFSFRVTTGDPDINPVSGIERKIKAFNGALAPQDRVRYAPFLSRSGR